MTSNEGTMYQRGPNGEVPEGQSFRTSDGQRQEYGTIGQEEHVTVYGQGWHRSWDNPGTTEDHSTDHETRQKTQH